MCNVDGSPGGADVVNGGTGSDTVSYDGNQAVTVNLALGTGQEAGGGVDTLISIESVIGSDPFNDTLIGGNPAPVLGLITDPVETFEGLGGNDTIDGGPADNGFFSIASYLRSSGPVTVNLGTGTAADGFGGTDALFNIDKVIGSANADTLIGGLGNDTLIGEAGVDSLAGGAGNDNYVVDDRPDIVTEALNAGTDTVLSSVNFTLPVNVENLTLTGAATTGAGNALANRIVGNALNNTLSGGDGNDTLVGGAGNDTLAGGLGNDTYVISPTGDVINLAGETGGTDTVQVFSTPALVTYTLAAGLENLVLAGAFAINGTGNTANNALTGNAAANTLNGGTGNDTMAGALGNDVYSVDSALDVVTEDLNADADRINSTVSITLLANNVENLTLIGAGNLNGTGNTLGNAITGNTGANLLDGGAGNDVLVGGTGADILRGNTGNDTLAFDATDTEINGGANALDADVLRIDGAGVSLTLTGRVGGTLQIREFEQLNLTGSGNNPLTLTAGDVLDISTTSNRLVVLGKAGDVANAGAGWTQGANASLAGQVYATYTQSGASLWVDLDITRSITA